jgi:hypothetical protein
MKSRSRANPFHLLVSHAFACLLLGVVLAVTEARAISLPVVRAETTRAHAIAIVKSILRANAKACRLRHGAISAKRVMAGWRVTARVTLSHSGKPFTATAIWTVRGDGKAVPSNQLTAEISNGCP